MTLAERIAAAMKAVHRSHVGCQVRMAEDRVAEFVASTERVASDGLIVLHDAWDTSRFLESGSFLWSHNRFADELPIGAPLAAEVNRETKQMRVKVRFAKGEDNPKAEQIYRLFKDGILRAVSVGFRILEMRDATPEERALGAWGVVTRAELYEVSAVSVPADAGAVLESIRTRAARLATAEDAEALRDIGASLHQAAELLAAIATQAEAPAEEAHAAELARLQAENEQLRAELATERRAAAIETLRRAVRGNAA